MKFKILFLALLVFLIIGPANAQDTLRIACLGNSITDGATLADPMDDGYPALLHKRLDSARVKEYAVGGRVMLRNGDYPLWNELEFERALEFDPNIVTIMLGTNDSKPWNWDHYSDEFITDYGAMIDTFKALDNNAQFIIGYPPPAFSNLGSIRDSVIFHHVIPKIDTIAAMTGATIVDFYAPLKDDPDMFPDGIHPNKAGHAKIAAILQPVIESMPEPVDTIAPTFTDVPETLAVYDTAAVWLEIKTRGPAMVKYGFNNQSYDAMPYTCSHTGGRKHRTLIRGEHGIPLTVYLHARDEAGNTTAQPSTVILFFDTTRVKYNWNDAGYDDSRWSRGAAPLGVNNSGTIQTDLNPVTTVYLRKTFFLENAAAVAALGMMIKGGDGVLVYLNGIQAGQENMPEIEKIDYSTTAETAANLNKVFVINTAELLNTLRDGDNIIGVEMHTADPDNPALLFDAQMFDASNQVIFRLGSDWIYSDAGLFPDPQLILKQKSQVRQTETAPHRLQLKQNYPNPFNPVTQIRYTLPVPSPVVLSVYDLTGAVVEQWVYEKQSAGPYRITFDGRCRASGLYFYQLQTAKGQLCRRMLLLK